MQSGQIETLVSQAKQQLEKQLQYSIFSHQHQKSLQLLQQLINIDPQNPQYNIKKATILFNLNRYKQCLKASQSIIKGSYPLDFYNMIIKCHLQTNNIELAQGVIDKVIKEKQQLSQFLLLTQTVAKLKNQDIYRLPEQDQYILAEMKNWLYPKGAKYDKVKIVTQKKGYRGAIATKSIRKSEVIVFIPKSQLLSLQMARDLPTSIILAQKQIELLSPKHTLMSLLLLEHRSLGKISQFHPYIEILPTDHSCFPINYSTEELTELIGSTFLYQIQQKVMDLKKDYDAVCYACEDFYQKYTFRDFCWARMMVGSRVFGVVIDGQKTEVLVPFADMLNHKVPKETVWNYSHQKKGFFIQSLKDISLGQELFDSYGKKCNSRFLLNYGFVLENNDRNQICIRVQFNENDPLLIKKLQMLKQDKNAKVDKIFRITKNIEENNFFQLMGYLRFKNIDKMQTLVLLEKISSIHKTNEAYNPSRSPPTSMEVQLKIWAQLKSLCQGYLSDYPTTLQHDQVLLKQHNLSQNMRNILVLRVGQKRLYFQYMEVAQSAIQILSKGYLQCRQAAKKHPQKDYCRYIQKILNLMPHQKNELLRKGNQPVLLEQNQITIEQEEQADQISPDF